MYIVRFVRNDDHPNEDYYYHFLRDAIDHFLLFENDTSHIYDEICLVHVM